MTSTAHAEYLATTPRKRASALTGTDVLSGVVIVESGDRGALTITPVPTEWEWDAVIATKELLLLSEGWDAEGALAVAPRAVEQAMHLLPMLVDAVPTLRRPAIYPSVDGGVFLEWETGDDYLSICFHPDGGGNFFYELADGATWESPADGEPLPIVQVLRRFT